MLCMVAWGHSREGAAGHGREQYGMGVMGNLVLVFPSRGNLKEDLQQQVLSIKVLQ